MITYEQINHSPNASPTPTLVPTTPSTSSNDDHSMRLIQNYESSRFYEHDPEQPTDFIYSTNQHDKHPNHSHQHLHPNHSISFITESRTSLILTSLLCLQFLFIVFLLLSSSSTHRFLSNSGTFPSDLKQFTDRLWSENELGTRNITRTSVDVNTETTDMSIHNCREVQGRVKQLEIRIGQLLTENEQLRIVAELNHTLTHASTTISLPHQIGDISTTTGLSDSPVTRLRFPHRIEAHPNFNEEANELGNYTWYFDQYDQEAYSFINAPITQPWYQITVNGSIDPSGVVGQFPFEVFHRRFLSSPEAYQKFGHALEYDPQLFYSAGIPILWGDTWGAAHWNREAERQFYHIFREQQYPTFNTRRPCHERKYVILEQKGKGSGFFSRFHITITLLQSAHLTGRELILTNREMTMGHSDDDYLREGINRYFMPLSECANSAWYQAIERDENQRSQWIEWKQPEDPFTDAMKDVQFIYVPWSRWNDDNWKRSSFARIHSPLRKHLFSYNTTQLHPQRYASQAAMLHDRTQHQYEHIYPDPAQFPVRPVRNVYYGEGHYSSYTRQDRLFLDFLLYMFELWMWSPLPRIQLATRALKQYWSSNLIDQEMSPKFHLNQTTIPEIKNKYVDGLSHMVSVHVRRGDKCREDPYCRAYGFFHDLGLVGYTMERRAQMNGRRFKSVFFMSDDSDVMKEVVACSLVRRIPNTTINWQIQPLVDPRLPSFRASGCRSEASEVAFGGLPITSNINGDCSNPFTRLGFENFLISINYIITYSEFAISYASSNIGRFLQEMLYSQRQVEQQLESLFTVYEDLVDNFAGGNITG